MLRPSTAIDFPRLLELAGDAVVVRDASGRIRFWNRGAERLYGYTADEAVDRVAHDLLRTAFPEPLEATTRRLAEDGAWEGLLRQTAADGRSLVVRSRWSHGADAGTVLEINRDDTPLDTAEAGRLRAERQFEQVTSHLPMMVATVDRSRRFTFANRAYTERFGLSPGEIVGQPVAAVIGAVAMAAIEPYVRQVLDGRPVEYELWVPYDRLGPRFMRCLYAPELDADGRVVGYIAALLDETARRTAEEALAVSRDRFDFVADSADVGVWSCDVPLADLIWNRACRAHFGVAPDAPVTIDTFYDRLHPDDRESTRQAIDAAIARGAGYDVEIRTRQGDGTYAWIRALGRTERDEHGQARRFVGVTINVTRQKQAEARLREADARKDEFLATLAHELRNPLAPLLTAVHLLASGATPDVVATVRGVLDRQVTHLVTLVDDLLDLSRITTGKLQLRRERLPIGVAVSAAVEACERMTRDARHDLTVALGDDTLVVDGDPTRLTQLFVNVLTNAVKYTPPGGRIAVRGGRRGADVWISVADSGIGLERQAADRIFEMFVQEPAARRLSPGGLGIGLTLVRQLVTLHGGQVTVESAGPGRGSTFTIVLPAASAPTAPEAERQTAELAAAPARVLVVDDNRDAVDTLALLLRRQGHEVVTAFDGVEAIGAGDALEPDVVLLDIGMPRMDGYDAARVMRTRPWGVRALIVAMSGWGQRQDVVRSVEAGIDHHLTKPVDPQSVAAVIRMRRASPSPP
jgi:PAS domain S-box-containing protein